MIRGLMGWGWMFLESERKAVLKGGVVGGMLAV